MRFMRRCLPYMHYRLRAVLWSRSQRSRKEPLHFGGAGADATPAPASTAPATKLRLSYMDYKKCHKLC
jgi:hypothetical protein